MFRPHPYLFWGTSKTVATVRRGDWKLIGEALYNVRTDIGEKTNLASSQPTVLADLRRARTQETATWAPPRW